MISRAARVPAPVYFVLAGLAVGAFPGIGVIRLPPDVVFYGFLPPLLYAAAFQTAPLEARANWREILVLAFGLTAATLFVDASYTDAITQDQIDVKQDITLNYTVFTNNSAATISDAHLDISGLKKVDSLPIRSRQSHTA